MHNISPTPYPDVNQILNIFLSNVGEILQDQLVGTYLFGSLANGDFDEHSDIDVLIVTDGAISTDKFLALQKLHKEINSIDSPWAIQVEASYIPRDALRRFDPANKLHPHMDRGTDEVLHMMSHEKDWVIQRHLFREHGIVISGPDLQTLIDPISADGLHWAIADVLPLWVNPIFEDPSQIKHRGYQSFFVLSLCRMLYTLRTGGILSKPAAAKWALDNMDSKWHTLIERAQVGRQNPSLNADMEDINGTLDMMRYTLQQTIPTPYPEVNEVLNLLLSAAKEILGDQFVGMYLYGSLSSGDFNPETSDIDFLFVTEDTLSSETIAQLEAMHKQTWASSHKRAGELEGAYLPKGLFRRHDPDGPPCPMVNEGRFYVEKLGASWDIQRHVVREFGVVIEGPDPKSLIDFVGLDDIRRAVMDILHEWWFPMLEDPSWLSDHPRGYHSYAILSMCRAMHTLEHGTIVSKPVAAHWAKEKLDVKWSPIIDLALLAQKPHPAEFDLLQDAINLIRYTKEVTTQ